jgi:molecular chaperone DnaK
MMKDAESHAEEAHRLREVADAKNLGETLAYQTERSLKEHRDKLDPAEAGTIEGRIMELRQAIEAGDLADIRAKTEALQEASHKLAEAVYQQAASSQQAHAGSDGAADDAEDEVIEEAEIVDEEAPTT